MNERIKKLIKKLDGRDVSEVDINAVVLSTHENEELIDKLIKYIDDNSDEKSIHLASKLLGIITKFFGRDKIEYLSEEEVEDIEETDEQFTSVYTISYKRENDDKMLHVGFNPSNIGQLRILGPTTNLNYVCVDLGLAYFDLKELDSDSRESFRKIDLYTLDNKNVNYSFKDVVSNLKHDIDKYDQIIIWSKKNNTNGYLLPYYFINKFFEEIKNKKVMIVNVDNLAGCDDLDELKIGQFTDLLKTIKILSIDDMEMYSKQWEEIKSHDCEIRDLVNNRIEYKNIKDYYDVIIKMLEEKGEIVRTKFIGELMTNNILCGGLPDIYSYIIDVLIEQGIVNSKDYKVPNCIPADIISVNKKNS